MATRRPGAPVSGPPNGSSRELDRPARYEPELRQVPDKLAVSVGDALHSRAIAG